MDDLPNSPPLSSPGALNRLPPLSPSPSPATMPFKLPAFSNSSATAHRSPSDSPPSTPSPGEPRSPSIVSVSMDSDCSPAPSVYSMTDSLRESSFIKIHGRTINTHSDVYMLPADDEEVLRLDTQHNIFKELQGGNYLGPVAEVLAQPPPHPFFPRRAILDLGTGTGTWAIEMAQDFPDCDVVGVDLSPIQPGRLLPPNCRVEVDDINLGLEHFYNSFDVVHARHICAGIKDYPRLLSQISQILRPGGLALLFEADYHICGPEKRPLVVSPGSGTPADVTSLPYLVQYASAFEAAVQRRGGSLDAGLNIPVWAKECGAFDQVVYQDVWLPTSPWCKGHSPYERRLRRVGLLLREDLISFFQSGRPLIISDGVPEAAVDEIIRRSRQELDEAELEMWIRGCYVWVRKAL